MAMHGRAWRNWLGLVSFFFFYFLNFFHESVLAGIEHCHARRPSAHAYFLNLSVHVDPVNLLPELIDYLFEKGARIVSRKTEQADDTRCVSSEPGDW